MQGLADAARSRSEADWLVGINGTRAMTAFNSRDGGFFLTTVGRVQTPTLAVVVEREEQIRKFISRDYWEIHAHASWPRPASTRASGSTRSGRRTRTTPRCKADRVWREREAAAIADAVRGKAATVTEESKPTTQASPLLFDLTSLQREANGRFGFSAKTTLALAQSLYERHKALTYPRTDSRALPEDYLPVVKQTMGMLANSGMRHLAPFAKQAIDEQLRQAEQAHLRQRQGQRSLRDHPDAAGAQRPVGRRAEALRPRGAPLPVGVLPAAPNTWSRPASRRRWATASRPRARCWSSPAGSRSTGKEAADEGPTPRKATRARAWCR